MACGLFSACFQTVFGSFPNVPRDDTFRSCAHARAPASVWDPFRATFLNPTPTLFRGYRRKLTPSPFTRQFGMGPILSLRFLPTTSPLKRVPWYCLKCDYSLTGSDRASARSVGPRYKTLGGE